MARTAQAEDQSFIDLNMEEGDEEPNPFLSPPLPALDGTPPPPLPPRTSTDYGNGDAGGTGFQGTIPSTDSGGISRGRTASANDNMGGGRGNPFAGPQQPQVGCPIDLDGLLF